MQSIIKNTYLHFLMWKQSVESKPAEPFVVSAVEPFEVFAAEPFVVSAAEQVLQSGQVIFVVKKTELEHK